jgi:hypothetical protein
MTDHTQRVQAYQHAVREHPTRQLPKIHAGSPLETNASINRDRATIAHNGGMTAQQIAAHWPEVFKCSTDGKLSQIYDYELADGSGRYETNRLITLESVADAIRKYGREK